MIYGLFSAWHHVQEVEAKLTTSQIERFQLASQVRRELQGLNNSMLRYVLARNPQQWALFEQASSDLNHWIDTNDPSMNPNSPLATEAERQSFQELSRVYDDYLAAAGAVHSNAQPAFVSSGQLAQLDAFDAQADRMRDLVRRLTDAHRTAQAEFLADASASLASLKGILTASIGVLLALVAAMGWVIYRDMIAPLTLGTLAAGIAHEIRNPLTSLKARLYTLEKHLQAVPAARKDTDIISAEISRLEHIVQDVLSFARPSDPKLETIAVDTLLRDVQGLMSPNLERRGVQLVVESNTELHIRADSGHLKQVLINLVRNGAEAIDGTGTVTLRSRAARAPVAGGEADAVILEVSDTGKGIPSEVEKRLFDPFFSTKETGTGLGLPIAARIIERHGGTLQYQTRPGHGTTFGVVLPREINDTAGNANRDASSPSAGFQDKP